MQKALSKGKEMETNKKAKKNKALNEVKVTRQSKHIDFVFMIIMCTIIVLEGGLILFDGLLPESITIGQLELVPGKEIMLTFLGMLYSTVFITTSLLSVLGNNKVMIFYENIIEKTLITPDGFDFKDLSIYAFCMVFFGTLSYIFVKPYAFVLSFLIGTTVIVLMFFKMIGIYFGRERWARRIIDEMENKVSYETFIDNLKKTHDIMINSLEEGNEEAFASNLMLIYRLKASGFIKLNALKKSGNESEDKEVCESRLYALDSVYSDAMACLDGKGSINKIKILLQVLTLLGRAKDSSKGRKAQIIIDKAIAAVTDDLGKNILELKKEDVKANDIGLLKKLYIPLSRPLIDYANNVYCEEVKQIPVSRWIEKYEKEEKDFSSVSGSMIGKNSTKYDDFYPDFSGIIDSFEYGKRAVRSSLFTCWPEPGICSMFMYFGDKAGCDYVVDDGIKACIEKDKEYIRKIGYKYEDSLINLGNEECDAFFYDDPFEEKINKLFVEYAPAIIAECGTAPLAERLFRLFYCLLMEDEDVRDALMTGFFRGCVEVIIKGCGSEELINKLPEWLDRYWSESLGQESEKKREQLVADSFKAIGIRMFFTDDIDNIGDYYKRPEPMVAFLKGITEAAITEKGPNRYIYEGVKQAGVHLTKELSKITGRYYSKEIYSEVKKMLAI